MWWVELLLKYVDFKDVLKCGAGIFMLLVFVSLIMYQRIMRSRDELRWQLKTRRKLGNEINKRSIIVESADNIITHPSYGIEKDDDPDVTLTLLDQEKWKKRESAAVGYEANTLVIFAILLFYLTSVLVRFVGLVGYLFIQQMDTFNRDQMYLFVLFIVLRPLLLALVYYYAKMQERSSYMEAYPSRVFPHLDKPEEVLFITAVNSEHNYQKAQLLIESIRSFGGTLRNSRIHVYETNSKIGSSENFTENEALQVKQVDIPSNLQGEEFSEKVYVCFHAEVWAAQKFRSLVWVSPDYLVLNPPELFDLEGNFDIAVRPVHVKNVGLEADADLDDYWRRIYDVVEVGDLKSTVNTFIGDERIRAYYNSHAFAVDPAKGLLRRCYEYFETLVSDEEFQKMISHDQKICLHQAILSALIANYPSQERIRVLPPSYNYPYQLHGRVPSARKPKSLNELVSIAYEDQSLDPRMVRDIEIHEPLRSGLIYFFDQTY